MEIRSVVAVLVTAFNAFAAACTEAAEEMEKLLSADGADTAGDEEEDTGKRKRKSRAKSKNNDDEDEKPKRRGRGKTKDEDEEEEEEEEEDGDEDEDEDGEPSEDDVIDAVRAAQKVLARDVVSKLVKKFGKADRPRDVKPDNRRHLIANLEKAVKDADE